MLVALAGLLVLGWWLRDLPSPTVGPERVAERFARCGSGPSRACVSDGDSFRIGQRRIRIRGIDAPEIQGSCPSESAMAQKSADRLVVLLNDGPFVMRAVSGDERDQYGRELRILTRTGANGQSESIGSAMIASGLARAYHGRKLSWC